MAVEKTDTDLLVHDINLELPFHSLAKNTKHLDQVQWSFQPREFSPNEFSPTILKTLHSFQNGRTTIPVRTIEWIEMLHKCQHPITIIGTDKGVCEQ